MRLRHGNRARLGGALLAALGALALLGALAGPAAAKDRNHDRIPDRWEHRHHLSLKVDQDRRDQDRDNLDNMGEFKAGDNPRDRDTDNDGVADGEENAGKITAYDAETGKLTIALFGGETVTGLVTEDTRIRCGHECHKGDQGDESGGETGATTSSRDEDNSGRGSHDSGSSDQGDNDQGDDNGNDNGEGQSGDDGPPMSGDGRGPGRGDDDNAADCGPEALVVGAEVDEAELELHHGTATFEEIELAP